MTTNPRRHCSRRPVAGPGETTRRPSKRCARGRHATPTWRRVSDYDVPVPGLDWTAAETAAHMIGDLRDYTEVLTRYAKGYVTQRQRPAESPAR